MRHTAILLAFATVALGLSGASATASASSRACRTRADEHVVARSSAAVVTVRQRRFLVGCSTVTGRRRVIDDVGAPIAFDVSTYFEEVALHGTWIAYDITYADRYETAQRLYRNDALHAHRRQLLIADTAAHVAIGPGGAVAYVTGGPPAMQLILARPGHHAVTVDGALHISDVAYRGDRLSWRHGTAALSVDPTPPDRCTTGRDTGTLALALSWTPTTLTGCWRATGATQTLTAGQVTSSAIGGSWLAIATGDGRIITADVLSGATETIAAPGAWQLAINAQGAVAWTVLTAGYDVQVLVHDAAGTRTIADDAYSRLYFGFDGISLVWGPKTTPVPR